MVFYIMMVSKLQSLSQYLMLRLNFKVGLTQKIYIVVYSSKSTKVRMDPKILHNH